MSSTAALKVLLGRASIWRSMLAFMGTILLYYVNQSAFSGERLDGTRKVRRMVAASSSGCAKVDRTLDIFRQLQHEYCVRHYIGEDSVPPFLVTADFTFNTAAKEKTIKLYRYKEHDIVSDRIVRFGSWESSHISMAAKAMDMASTRWGVSKDELYFLDIGANIGTWGAAIASAGYKVIAVEAMQYNEAALRASVCANDLGGKITIVPRALGDSHELCYLVAHDNNMGNGILKCGVSFEELPKQFPDLKCRGRAEMTTLDNLLLCEDGSLRTRIAAIKMDVEGYEPFVFKGAHKALQASRAAFITYEQSHMSPEEQRAVLQSFVDLGYWHNCDNGQRVRREIDNDAIFLGIPEHVGPCWDIYLWHEDFVDPKTRTIRHEMVSSGAALQN